MTLGTRFVKLILMENRIPKDKFQPNREVKKQRKQLDQELNKVEEDILARKSRGLDTEDDQARYANLKEARDRMN